MCTCKKCYLLISGVIFGLVAIAHAARLIYHWHVQIGDQPIPNWPSWVGVVVSGVLSGWAFCALCGRCCCRDSTTKTP